VSEQRRGAVVVVEGFPAGTAGPEAVARESRSQDRRAPTVDQYGHLRDAARIHEPPGRGPAAELDPVTAPIRLLIAHNAPTRAGIRLALGADVDTCAEVADSDQAIRAAKREQPEVCIVGREIPGDWLAAVRGISRAAPGAGVVVVTPQGDIDDLLEAVRAGAVGYVADAGNTNCMRRIVRAAAAHEAVIPRTMVLELLLEVRGSGSTGDLLTRREAQVLGMLRRGHSTAEIARRLDIAPVTVRRHISDLVRKLGVGNRSALTAGGVSGAETQPSPPDLMRVRPVRS
jgi:DNA-binding NarL/FixJ family response regulator